MEQLPDYENWSNGELVKRVTELEAQLRAQNIKYANSTSSHTSPAPPIKKPKKAPKPFDPSRYSTRLIALKFAYLGKRYNGFEHHTNNTTPLPTIEEELSKALRKTRLIFPNFKEGQSEDEVCWDGCEYSKCGRTDRGVSAFGQVIGVRVRSCRPKEGVRRGAQVNEVESQAQVAVENGGDSQIEESKSSAGQIGADWDPITDELPYIQLLNRVLPPDIRVLAWCPDPPPGFSARFSCKERRYRYFFTNPAYSPMPREQCGTAGRGAWLDIEAMQQAAKKLEGLHDFRNFSKIDPTKQISRFDRRIFHASIKPVNSDQSPGAFLSRPPYQPAANESDLGDSPQSSLYYFEVHGSAFLWHQVRHMVAILFLVGQGYEDPSVVDDLLNIQKTPARPIYDMASDTPLVLWDCVFPDLANTARSDHDLGQFSGYEDALDWVYAGDHAGAVQSLQRNATGVEDRKYGRLSIMEDLWSLWRKTKIDELLAGSLMDIVARQGKVPSKAVQPDRLRSGDVSARVFDGSEVPRTVGTHVPLMQRERLESPEIVNARYAARKGLNSTNGDHANMDE